MPLLKPPRRPPPRRRLPPRYSTTAPEEEEKYTVENKVTVVTGAAAGIGYAVAREFLRRGAAAVNAVDADGGALREAARRLRDDFGEERVLASEADCADTEQMDAAFRNSSVHFQAIDVIVNNAGVLDDANWERQLRTNVRGSVIGTLLGMQYMAKSSSGAGGVIVNVGSTMAVEPSRAFPIHTMTQFGIAGFTRALGSSKLHERTGVRVFAFCPALTDTAALLNVPAKTINRNFAAEFEEEARRRPLLPPDLVARGLADALAAARPGSLWLVEPGRAAPFEMRFPPYSYPHQHRQAEEEEEEQGKKKSEEEGKLGGGERSATNEAGKGV